jgi:hypothetical protein
VCHLQWTHVALLPPPSWHTSYNICAPPGSVSFLFLFWRFVFCAHSLIVRLTYQPEMVTPGCLSPDVYHNVNSGLVNKIVINREHSSTWLVVGKLGQGMRCCKCNSNSNVFVCETRGKVCICMGESVSAPGSVCVCLCVCVSSCLISFKILF